MKYINLIYEYAGELDNVSKEEYQGLVEQHQLLQKKSKKENAYICATQLKPFDTAVSVRVRNSKKSITDGPFTESKELFVGIYLLECADLDAALIWAKMIPVGSKGGVEVRPLDSICDRQQAKSNDAKFKLKANTTFYALLIYQAEMLLEANSAEQTQQLIQGNTAMAENASTVGDYVTGFKLMPTLTATTIQGIQSQKQITDGPFTESKEVLIGMHIVACQQIDEAIAYAQQIPDVNTGVVEVRPIHFHDQVGEEPFIWTS